MNKLNNIKTLFTSDFQSEVFRGKGRLSSIFSTSFIPDIVYLNIYDEETLTSDSIPMASLAMKGTQQFQLDVYIQDGLFLTVSRTPGGEQVPEDDKFTLTLTYDQSLDFRQKEEKKKK